MLSGGPGGEMVFNMIRGFPIQRLELTADFSGLGGHQYQRGWEKSLVIQVSAATLGEGRQ